MDGGTQISLGFLGVQIFLKRVQKSGPGQLPARISPSSDGVEIKTGYVHVGLPTQRVLSRRLVFRANRTS